MEQFCHSIYLFVGSRIYIFTRCPIVPNNISCKPLSIDVVIVVVVATAPAVVFVSTSVYLVTGRWASVKASGLY